MKVDECRSCREPVVWATTERGNLMPVDVKPDPAGRFELLEQPDGTVFAAYRVDAPPESRHRSHFATCRDAKKWKRKEGT